MGHSYQLLTTTDTSRLKGLSRMFGDAFNESTYVEKIPSDEYLTSLLSKSHFIALVAIDEAEVIGGIVAYELEKFEQERKEVYIYDLAVAEPHRRKGVATGLIQELKRIAKERGAYAIYVQADKADTPAIKLYESLGKKEDVFHFDIEM